MREGKENTWKEKGGREGGREREERREAGRRHLTYNVLQCVRFTL